MFLSLALMYVRGSEYLARGSLYRLLHHTQVTLEFRRRLKMGIDISKGMAYLHSASPAIVHRDLKSPNLLVDENFTGASICF
jgi:serine/threonine protein kinase